MKLDLSAHDERSISGNKQAAASSEDRRLIEAIYL